LLKDSHQFLFLAKSRKDIIFYFHNLIIFISRKMTDSDIDNKGYIYCFSNELMPGVYKIGMTERTPDIRLREANSITWTPSPYQIEFAKFVLNAKHKEFTLHKLLTQYTERINPRREFFRVSSSEVKALFDLMDGEWWKNPSYDISNNIISMDIENQIENEYEYDEEYIVKNRLLRNNSFINCSRDLSKYFSNEQRVRHTIGINKEWIGIYDGPKNGIVHNDNLFISLSGFANAHHRSNGSYKHNGVNGWACTECEINGIWVPVKTLTKIPD
jgi:hypothetical protein